MEHYSSRENELLIRPTCLNPKIIMLSEGSQMKEPSVRFQFYKIPESTNKSAQAESGRLGWEVGGQCERENHKWTPAANGHGRYAHYPPHTVH